LTDDRVVGHFYRDKHVWLAESKRSDSLNTHVWCTWELIFVNFLCNKSWRDNMSTICDWEPRTFPELPKYFKLSTCFCKWNVSNFENLKIMDYSNSGQILRLHISILPTVSIVLEKKFTNNLTVYISAKQHCYTATKMSSSL
jgi:hypothetical protein